MNIHLNYNAAVACCALAAGLAIGLESLGGDGEKIKAKSASEVACFNAYAQTEKLKTGNYKIVYDDFIIGTGASTCELVPK